MISIQLIDSKPDTLLVDLRVHLLPEGLRDFARRFPAVTPLPDKRRGLIETMGPVTLKIINEHFIRQLVNYQSIFRLTIRFHDQSSFRNFLILSGMSAQLTTALVKPSITFHCCWKRRQA